MSMLLAFYGVEDLSIFPELSSASVEVMCVPVQEDILSVEFSKKPDLILCKSLGLAERDLEMAQVFRMNTPEAKIYLIKNDSFDFDKATMRKNGLDDAFILPWEKDSLLSTIETTSIYLRNPKLIEYTPIFLVDFDPDEELSFDVFIYLPMNCILVPLARAGEFMSLDKLARARETFQNVAYVHKNSMPDFREYFHRASTKRGERGVSESEKFMSFERTCRELLSNLFVDNLRENTFTKSTQLMDDLKYILNDYVDVKNPKSFVKSLGLLMNRPSGPYNHAIHVALYAAMFGICLNLPQPFDLAMAGLLHDIGLSELDEKLFTQAPDEVPSELAKDYKRHGQLTIEMLKKKKIALSDNIFRAILHHHDSVSESPNLSKETRLLAIADTFDYLTRQNSGKKGLSPEEAFQLLLEKTASNPGAMQLDIDMLKEIIFALDIKDVA